MQPERTQCYNLTNHSEPLLKHRLTKILGYWPQQDVARRYAYYRDASKLQRIHLASHDF